MKMKRKKILLEEYNNTDITKLKTSYEAEKEDLMTAITELTQKYTDMKLTAEGLIQENDELNKRKNKLKKGGGYNMDLAVMGLICGLCSITGLPWMCAATVRAVQHQNALAVMSETGEGK